MDLMELLVRLRDRFLASHVLDVESAVNEVFAELSKQQIQDVVRITNEHFILSVCPLDDIINDEKYGGGIEGTEFDIGQFIDLKRERPPGEVGPLVGYEITADNVAAFLNREGSNSLRSHLRAQLPEEEWHTLEAESEKRYLADATARGTIFTPRRENRFLRAVRRVLRRVMRKI